MRLDELEKGDKVDVHITLYTSELYIIDALREKYKTSRAAIIGALVKEFQDVNFAGKITPGNRPGGGRPSKQ